MPRPSQNTDKCLIEAAQGMLRKTGLSRMNLRQVAAKAGVNLGMFHYHFKTKDKFIRAVLQDSYEKFFRDFTLKIEEGKSPLEKLRQALFALATFARDNRQLFVSLLQDALNGNDTARDFVGDNFLRHGMVVRKLVLQCQLDKSLRKMSAARAMVFLMGAINMSSLLVTVVEQAAASKSTKIAMKGFGLLVLSDDAIQERVDMALRGLSVPSGGKK